MHRINLPTRRDWISVGGRLERKYHVFHIQWKHRHNIFNSAAGGVGPVGGNNIDVISVEVRGMHHPPGIQNTHQTGIVIVPGDRGVGFFSIEEAIAVEQEITAMLMYRALFRPPSCHVISC